MSYQESEFIIKSVIVTHVIINIRKIIFVRSIGHFDYFYSLQLLSLNTNFSYLRFEYVRGGE